MPRSPWGGLSAEEMRESQTDLSRMLPDNLFATGTDSQIGEQYFANTGQLPPAAGVAALLLIDIADPATTGADNAAQIELSLVKINRDLGVDDAKLPPPVDGSGGRGSNPHNGRR
jgi:hypothetical protein